MWPDPVQPMGYTSVTNSLVSDNDTRTDIKLRIELVPLEGDVCSDSDCPETQKQTEPTSEQCQGITRRTRVRVPPCLLLLVNEEFPHRPVERGPTDPQI